MLVGAKKLKSAKCPSDEHALTNCAAVSKSEFDLSKTRHFEVRAPGSNKPHVLTFTENDAVQRGTIGLSMAQRKWTDLMLNADVDVRPCESKLPYISNILLEVDFSTKKGATTEPVNSDDLAKECSQDFVMNALALSDQQQLIINFQKKRMFTFIVKELEVLVSVDQDGKPSSQKSHCGKAWSNMIITFQKAEGSSLVLTGKSQGKLAQQSIIAQDWDFNKIGIGGLDTEFNDIFRRAFSSRVYPPELVEELGVKHVRGMLLYGPPGTGKTLMARQIAKMLNAREPKIVNGPQILDKYVGESEANIRKLFQDAEEEQKKCGSASGLHIIIFDEIDAICKTRGSMAGSTAVHDTVVNQLLSKIDGVDELNNIFVIGMTNRKDLIDEALLRPGRLEVQLEIGLPDEKGRVQILKIHMSQALEHKRIAPDVDIGELATLTKNFSGAELAGLVRCAAANAMNRLIKASSKIEIDPEARQKLRISKDDFSQALKEVKPSFGAAEATLDLFIANGIYNWGIPVQKVLEEGELLLSQTKSSSRTPLVAVLFEGPPGCGKTALAAHVAKGSEFPFLRVCSPERFVGYHESAKCQAIKMIFDDAYKSPLSVVILDDIERLIDYAPIGPRYSNLVLQALLVLMKQLPPKGRKLMIIGTTSRKDLLDELEILNVFSAIVSIENIVDAQDLINALEMMECFTAQQCTEVYNGIKKMKLNVGIKKLLALVEAAKQVDSDKQVNKFLSLLMEQRAVVQ